MPAYKNQIDQENPARNPIETKEFVDDPIVEENPEREVYTVQRTVVQTAEVSKEEYE